MRRYSLGLGLTPLLLFSLQQSSVAQTSTHPRAPQRTPLAFTKDGAQFITHSVGAGIRLNDQGATIGLVNSARLRMSLLNGGRQSVGSPEQLLPGTVNYLFGNDSTKWKSNLPTFGKVHFSNVYPGIDLVYYGSNGKLEYDFIVKPGADASTVEKKNMIL